MARLPSTIYQQILKRQKELFDDGSRNGTISIEEAQAIFAEAGYKTSTANKWLLNWAVSRILCFEKDIKAGCFCIRLGQFYEKTVSECMADGKVWLPVKECKVQVKEGYWGDKQVKMQEPVKSQGWLL